MRILIVCLVFLTGCTLSAQKSETEHKKEADFNKLIDNANKNHTYFKSAHDKSVEKEKKLISQAITKIITLKEEVKDLKTEMVSMKTKTDTVYIHDTIRVSEKKSFWGKTKVDTLN